MYYIVKCDILEIINMYININITVILMFIINY